MGARTIGIDFASTLVRVANYKIRHQKLNALCLVSEAEHLPFKDESFDVVSCCGSVLNYVMDYKRTISEMSRMLKPRGALVLGIDNKLTLESLWHLLNPLTIKEELGYLLHDQDMMIESPHVMNDGEIVYLPVRFFSYGQVKKELSKENIKVSYCFGIHSVTSIIPYTIASNPEASPLVKEFLRFLIRIDGTLIDKYPFTKIASHLVIVGRKTC